MVDIDMKFPEKNVGDDMLFFFFHCSMMGTFFGSVIHEWDPKGLLSMVGVCGLFHPPEILDG